MLANPAAARGKALDAAPAACDALTALGASHRLVVTRDIEHAVHEAAAAAAAGEDVVAVGGDGFAGPIAGAVRGTESSLCAGAGRARQRLRPRARPAE